jgi:hypothetical protein
VTNNANARAVTSTETVNVAAIVADGAAAVFKATIAARAEASPINRAIPATSRVLPKVAPNRVTVAVAKANHAKVAAVAVDVAVGADVTAGTVEAETIAADPIHALRASKVAGQSDDLSFDLSR